MNKRTDEKIDKMIDEQLASLQDVFTNHYFLTKEQQEIYFDWVTNPQMLKFPQNPTKNVRDITFDDAKIMFYRLLTRDSKYDDVRKIFNIYTHTELKENFDEIVFDDKDKLFNFLSTFSNKVFTKDGDLYDETQRKVLQFLNEEILSKENFKDDGTLLPLNNFFFTCEIPWNMMQESDVIKGGSRFITKTEKCRFLVQTIELEDTIVLSISLDTFCKTYNDKGWCFEGTVFYTYEKKNGTIFLSENPMSSEALGWFQVEKMLFSSFTIEPYAFIESVWKRKVTQEESQAIYDHIAQINPSKIRCTSLYANPLFYYINSCIEDERTKERASRSTSVVKSSGKTTNKRDQTPQPIMARKIVLGGMSVITTSNKVTRMRLLQRKCLCWSVRGHLRHYKSGKTVYIKPFQKGVNRKTETAKTNTYVIK